MVSKEGKSPQNQPPRGFQFKSGHPEAPSESRRVVESRVIDDSKIRSRLGTAFARGTAQGAPSIVEQSRALRHNPQLIYQFVHDQIEWEPGWGANRGALGTILDGMGNAFDQSMLMIELLREAGFTANYILGTIELSEAEYADWFGTTSIWASYNYCGNENIPAETPTWNGSGWDMIISHVWVECEIDSTMYIFDPTRKSYTRTSPVSDLDEILEYSGATFISNAEDGATVDSEYVQNMNTANIHSDLTQMTTNLIAWIEANDPDATIDDILGGQTIVPATIPLLQTSLPYAASEADTWTGDVPIYYKTTLRIRFPGNITDWSIDEIFTSDELAGARLTLFFNSSLEPVLALNGDVIATGDAQGSGTWNSVLLTVTHNAYSVNWYDQEWWQSFIWAGRYYLIGNAWGNLGTGQMEFHQDQLAANEAAGGASTDEPILGEKLAITFYSWAAQNSRVCDLVNRMTRCHTMYNHQVGIISFDAGDLLGTDLGGVSGSSTNLDNDVTKTPINDTVLAMHGVALEAAVLMQVIRSGRGASTTTVIDQANTDGDKIYKGTSTNWNTGTDVSNILEGNGYNPTDLNNIYNWFIQWGYDVLISEDPSQTIDSWQGWGYWAYPNAGAFGIINGGLKGGKQEGPPDPDDKKKKKGDERNDPIDVLTGSYIYQHSDIVTGTQRFPYQLAFERSYRSDNRFSDGPLGFGWNHNHSASISVSSDPFAAMGALSAVETAATIAELFVCIDLISDTNRPVSKLVIMTLADRWWIDRVCFNYISVNIGYASQVFAIRPDGSFAARNNFPATLAEDSGEYDFATSDVSAHFNSSGQLETQVFPLGMTLTYTYADGKLTGISNGLGRSLTLGYDNDRIVSVEDETERAIGFDYDEDGNLTEFTDCNSEVTTYEYDALGRMTKIFYPGNPLDAFVQNTYDTLNRVKEQRDGYENLWVYYLAGSRSEEIDPDEKSWTVYFDNHGNGVNYIDQLGQVTTKKYDGLSRRIKETLPEGNSTEYEYDLIGKLVKITYKPKPGSMLDDVVEEFAFEETWNKVSSFTDSLGNITTLEYDETTGLLLRIELPEVNEETPEIVFEYNNRGQILERTDPTGIVVRFSYSEETEVVESMIQDYGDGRLNLLTSFEFDDVGNLESVTDPRGNQRAKDFDSQRQLTETTSPTPFSFVTQFEYDENGNRRKVKRSTGDLLNPWQVFETTYTEANQIHTIADPLSNTMTYEYDELRRIASIEDAEEREIQRTYDELSRLSTIVDATNTTIVTNQYTDNGLLASVEDANENVTTYQYDGFDRLIKITYPDDTFEEFSWNAKDKMVGFINRGGDEIVFDYDALDRLIEKAPDNQPVVSIEYDLAGRKKKISTPTQLGDPGSGEFEYFYDTAGRLIREEMPDGKEIEYELDENGNVIKVTYPDGYYVQREFDEMDRLVNIKLNGSTTAAIEFQYDDLSRRKKIIYQNTVETTFEFTLNDAVESVGHVFDGSSVLIEHQYNGVVAEIERNVDDSNYLWHPASGGTISYGTANGLNQYPTVGGQNQSYNDNGCLTGDGTWTFGYDTENRLTSASKTGVSVAYLYDPQGRQVQKAVTTTGTDKIRFVYGGWYRLTDYDGSDVLLRRFVYGKDFDEPLIEIASGGGLTYLHIDKQGSIIATSDGTGAVSNINKFGSFGETDTISGTSFGFAGQRYESETGLYYFKNRYYAPALGRYLQPDSLRYIDGLNMYTYVDNDPLNKRDPLGLLTDLQLFDLDLDVGVAVTVLPVPSKPYPPTTRPPLCVLPEFCKSFKKDDPQCAISQFFMCPSDALECTEPDTFGKPCPHTWQPGCQSANPEDNCGGGGGGGIVPPVVVPPIATGVSCGCGGGVSPQCRTGPDCHVLIQTPECYK